jgi:hypothetical protein
MGHLTLFNLYMYCDYRRNRHANRHTDLFSVDTIINLTRPLQYRAKMFSYLRTVYVENLGILRIPIRSAFTSLVAIVDSVLAQRPPGAVVTAGDREQRLVGHSLRRMEESRRSACHNRQLESINSEFRWMEAEIDCALGGS